MKTLFTIVITAAVTWVAAAVVHGVRTGTDRLWMVSAVKSPGRMALADIQADMAARRYGVAKAKLDVFATTWQGFADGPDSCSGEGIGDIMVTFSKIPNVEPDEAANGSEQIRLETNSTSSVDGAGR